MTQQLLNRAREAYARGDHRQALTLLEPLTAPDQAPEAVLALAANAAVLSGSDQLAIDLMSRLRARWPGKPVYARILAQVFNRIGVASKANDQALEAESAFQSALAHWPEYEPALFNLASLYSDRQRFAAAMALLHRLRSLAPQDSDVAREIVLCLAKDEQHGAAADLMDTLPQPDPDKPTSCLLHAEALAWTDRIPQMRALLADLSIDDSHTVALGELAFLLGQLGHIDAATELLARLLAFRNDGRTAPGLQLLFRQHLLLPPVYTDRPHLARERSRFDVGLNHLAIRLEAITADSGFERSLEQIANESFLLAYQGEDDRALMARRGELLTRIAPHFVATGSLTEIGADQSAPIRIGLVSSHFRHCTAGHYFGSWIAMLADAGYEVHVFQLGTLFDDYTTQLGTRAHRLHRLEGPLDAAATVIARSNCNLLIYPELGMESRLLPLASLRLAPRQFCGWGHPVTSGLPTIDAYLSCAEMEPADGADHYSERLLLLPGLGTDYYRPNLPEPLTRQSLGLPDGANLYLLPHAPFKMHPDNDTICAAITARDPDAVLVMFRGEHPAPVLPLRRRLATALAEAGADPVRQLLILPMVSRERFLQINMACNVMVDALHWSGGNTSIDALLCGLPIVTSPGRFMRGRQSAAMLKRVGLTDLVVDSTSDLIDLAIAIAGDRDRQLRLRQIIAANLPVLFDASGVADALCRHVEEALSRPDDAET